MVRRRHLPRMTEWLTTKMTITHHSSLWHTTLGDRIEIHRETICNHGTYILTKNQEKRKKLLMQNLKVGFAKPIKALPTTGHHMEFKEKRMPSLPLLPWTFLIPALCLPLVDFLSSRLIPSMSARRLALTSLPVC